MFLKELLLELESSEEPVSKIMYESNDTRMLAIAFKENMSIVDCIIPDDVRSVNFHIIQGSIEYKEETLSVMLEHYDDFKIPLNNKYSINALSESICLIVYGL